MKTFITKTYQIKTEKLKGGHPVRFAVLADLHGLVFGKTFRCLSTDGTTFDKIKKKLILPNEVKAPVKKGQKAGELVYYQENRELGRIPVIYAENVKKAGYLDRLKQTAEEFCL